MVQGARARADAGFGKWINTKQDFSGSPDHEAGLEASGWHPPMGPTGAQTQACMQGCVEPCGAWQGTGPAADLPGTLHPA